MTKTSNIIMALAAIALMGGCTQEDDQQNAGLTEIRLTTSINQTRATTTQDVQIADDEQVYVWAFKQAASGAAEFATPYIKAWQLEADGAGGLSSVNTTHYYYPTEKLTFVGIHGNFSETLTESSTAMPTTVTHTVESNQNSAANYAKSDLLRWEAYDKATSSSAITAQFSHQLTKIVVVLNSSEYNASELNAATITINGIKRQITLNPQTAALGSASGSATAITPYHTANIHHEAIVPPQDKPDGLITIAMNGWSTTLTPSLPASAFAANTKYTYTLDVKKQQVTMTESITQWNDYTAGGSDPVTITDEQGIAPRNVKMNPLWYVAKSNLNQDGNSFSITGSTSQGYLWMWNNSTGVLTTSLGITYNTSGYNGWYSVGKVVEGNMYHLPTEMEWASIVPAPDNTSQNLFASDKFPSAGTVVTEPACTFGYNDDTKYGVGNTSNPATPVGTQFKSYWSSYTANSNVRYAIRFLGTDYCSVWKYEALNLGTTSGRLVISAKLIDMINTDENAKLTAMMTTIQNSDFDWSENEAEGAIQRTFYACGYTNQSNSASPGTYPNSAYKRGLYWSASPSGSNSYGMDYYENSLNLITGGLRVNAFSVRLFRDNNEQDVMKNPLWYVAEYNMTNATTMASTDNAGYFFNWSDAMTNFGASTSSYNGYKKGNKTITGKTGTWHLPTKYEYWSIVPWGGNMWSDSNYDSEKNYYRSNNVYLSYFGCNYETKTVGVYDHSFWHKVSETEVHAIRFLGTPYCSAWKYVWSGATLTIYATMIDPIADDGTGLAAKIWYNNYWNSVTWGNNASKGAIQRNFYARGAAESGSGSTASTGAGTFARYWCTTEYNNTTGTRFSFSNGITYVDTSSGDKVIGMTVRLFLDN